MDMIGEYLRAFVCGGILCLIGQILIDKTKLTPARILVSYVVAGVILGGLGIYQPIADWGGAGATVPLTGFGFNLAKGVKKAVAEKGLLGAITGCILNVVGIARAFVYSNKEQPWAKHKLWLYGFIAAYFGVYILTFAVFGKEPSVYILLLELLPVIGMVCTTVGFYLEKASQVRALALMNAPTWLTYNIFNRSVGGALTEIFCLISVVVGIVRLDIRKKPR